VGRIEDIRARLLQKDDPTIIEVGACYFNHTRVFLETFPGVTLYTFEPHPRLAARYPEVIGDDPRCRFFQCAVGDSDGTTLLRMSRWLNEEGEGSREWEASSSIVACADHSTQYPALYFPETAEVPLIRLDTWAEAEDVGPVDFIWTDVQGAERQLLEGATALLERTDYIQLEFGECGSYPGVAMSREETVALLDDLGFVEVPEYTNSIVWGRDGPPDEWNTGDLLFANTGTLD
jgi:FkbM family methyltransferase